MSVFTPVNQVRLTNVATVKLMKKGKRFEIACYRNKVLSWRNKVETDLGEVLQIDSIFANVSKGMLASAKDLSEVFGTTDLKTICKEILDKGELQVSEQERVALHESIFRDIASIVADKTINPETNRPYTVAMIQNAMRQIQFSVQTSKPSKSQALDVIRKLRDVMPIARASMLLRVTYREADQDALMKEVDALNATVHASSKTDQKSDERFVDLLIDPEVFRKLEEVVAALPSGVGRLDVLQLRMNSASVGVSESKMPDEDDLDEPAAAVPIPKSASQKKGKEVVKSRGKGGEDLQALLMQMGALGSDEESAEEEMPVPPLPAKSKKDKKSQSADVDAPGAAATLSTPAQKVLGKTKVSKSSKRAEEDEKEEAARRAKELHSRLLREKQAKEVVSDEQRAEDAAAEAPAPVPVSAAAVSGGKSCNTCGGLFVDAQAHREHFKSEWHRFNLKRKMKGLSVIPSEEAFLALSVAELHI